MRLSRGVVCVVALTLVASACGGSHAAKKHKPPPSTTTTTAGPPVAPLTGLPDPTGQSLTRPALSIKIENTPEARPQTGLDQADVVYEEVTEGGITRFMAVFNSQVPPVVGPIRSARAMDPDLFTPLGGIFAYSGADTPNVALVNAVAGVDVIADNGTTSTGMYRDPTKVSPHNLYGHTALLFAKGGKPVPAPALFQYLPKGAVFQGAPVTSFTVNFDPPYAPTYTWDLPSGTWKRSIQGAPFVDTDGVQDAAQNVIVMFVPCCIPGTAYTDTYGAAEGANYQTTGTGDAWVFSNGALVLGHWSRASTMQPIQYTNASGQAIRLTPGRTWVELMPTTGAEFGATGPETSLVSVNPPSSAIPPPPTTTTTTTAKSKKKSGHKH